MDSQTIEQLGTDVILSADVLRSLMVSREDLADSNNVVRLHEIMSYLKNIPEKDRFIYRSGATRSPEKIRHLWEYVELNKKRDETKKTVRELDDEIMRYEV